MNHLESTFKGKNGLWRYVVMIIAVFLASNSVGALPILISIIYKYITNPELYSAFSANPGDYSVLGIDSNLMLVMMLFPFIAALATFVLLIKPLNARTFSNTINGTGKIRWRRFFISALVWLVLSAIYFLLYYKFDPQNFSLNNQTFSIVILTLISLLMIPFQASFEEILFRGYLMQGFTALVAKRWFPLIMTSILFGLLHGLNPEVKEYGFLTMMPQYILFGLIFGVITILDDGIEAAMGAHTANNAFLCIMVTNKSSALQTAALYEQHSIYPWTEFGALLVVGIIFVVILKKIFGWKSFGILMGDVKKVKKQSDSVN